mmetsp:Transcript_62122/g.133577  ORF Transcript_62122/g.133577 Transcript_62122/m.133577 type:complete len:282 (-) Transcript_62122:1447-2292(-)
MKLITVSVGFLEWKDINASCDGTSGVRVVASDHHHLNSCLLSLDHRYVHAVLRGILDAIEADELEVLHWEVAIRHPGALEPVRGDFTRCYLAPRDGEHPAGLRHEILHSGLDLCHAGCVVVDRAEFQYPVGRSLHDRKDALLAGLAMDREHPFVLGVEWDLEELVVRGLILAVFHLLCTTMHIGACFEDSDLRWGACPPLLAILHLDLCTVVQNPGERDQSHFLLHLLRERASSFVTENEGKALRCNAAGACPCRDGEVLDLHLALGERARLVGAKHRDAP